MLKNIICLWAGAVVDIPAGWALCDGNAGRPDLRDKFVIGAGDTYAPDDNGGAVNHTHEFTGNGHTHGIPNTLGCPGAGVNLCLDGEDTDSAPAAGTTGSDGVLPPYYALCYIMKL